MKWLVAFKFLQSTAPTAYIPVPGKEFWVVTLSCQKQAILALTILISETANVTFCSRFVLYDKKLRGHQ